MLTAVDTFNNHLILFKPDLSEQVWSFSWQIKKMLLLNEERDTVPFRIPLRTQQNYYITCKAKEQFIGSNKVQSF